jgi:hypothetical protein
MLSSVKELDYYMQHIIFQNIFVAAVGSMYSSYKYFAHFNFGALQSDHSRAESNKVHQHHSVVSEVMPFKLLNLCWYTILTLLILGKNFTLRKFFLNNERSPSEYRLALTDTQRG